MEGGSHVRYARHILILILIIWVSSCKLDSALTTRSQHVISLLQAPRGISRLGLGRLRAGVAKHDTM